MKILIAGASGFVGSALTRTLKQAGHEVVVLVRGKGYIVPGQIAWNPEKQQLDAADLEGFDALVNLSGENISSGKWDAEKKRKIRDSRVLGTRLLAAKLAEVRRKPRVWVNASAIGYYGNAGDSELTEAAPAGDTFLSQVCKDWEDSAQADGVRIVKLRIGMVLSPQGGALEKMLLPFKLGVGGVIGSGRQYMSWIALQDLVGIILFVIGNDTLDGPVNAVSPEPVTNRKFTKTLGKVLHRPTLFPLPAFAARLVFGEMADELLLSSARVIPEKLIHSGYEYQAPQLVTALRMK